jgi:hypothetical protein
MVAFTTHKNIKKHCTDPAVLNAVQRGIDTGYFDPLHLPYADLFKLLHFDVAQLLVCEQKYAPLWRHMALTIAKNLCTKLPRRLCIGALDDLHCSGMDLPLTYLRDFMRDKMMKGVYPGYAEEYFHIVNVAHPQAYMALKSMIEVQDPKVENIILETLTAGFCNETLTVA